MQKHNRPHRGNLGRFGHGRSGPPFSQYSPAQPSPVPDRVLRAISRQVIDHRGPEFQKLGGEVLEGCQAVFETRLPVVSKQECHGQVAGKLRLFRRDHISGRGDATIIASPTVRWDTYGSLNPINLKPLAGSPLDHGSSKIGQRHRDGPDCSTKVSLSSRSSKAANTLFACHGGKLNAKCSSKLR
jgi:hypothetical protein